jgi:hypothetical protein
VNEQRAWRDVCELDSGDGNRELSDLKRIDERRRTALMPRKTVAV